MKISGKVFKSNNSCSNNSGIKTCQNCLSTQFWYILHTGIVKFWYILELLHVINNSGPYQNWTILVRPRIEVVKYKMTMMFTSLSQPAGHLGAFLDTQTLKKNPPGHPNIFVRNPKNLNLKLIIEFFHLLMIPMTLFNDIMPYFDEFIHVQC